MARARAAHKAKRAKSSRRAKAKKPKDVHVNHGGHSHRTVNAPKTW
jgi:hypothetical protein